ncbi:MAG: hypothetical protein IJW16_02795 [Clostridia bacterium]|nr:hypothetical protein [Clostridia bacterium]
MKNARRIISMLLAVLMVLSSMVVATTVSVSAEEDHGTQPTTWWDEKTTATAFAGGDGKSEATAYQIATADQLAYFAKYLEGGALNAKAEKTYFKLTADVDMSAHQWRPIGHSATLLGTAEYVKDNAALGTNTLYNAVFDGGNFTVSGLKLTAGADYQYANGCALFTSIQKSTIQNLKLEVKILDPQLKEYGMPSLKSNGSAMSNCKNAVATVAALAVNSTVKNVTATVDIDVRDIGGVCVVSGLVGSVFGTDLSGCTVKGDINSSSADRVFVAGVLAYYQGGALTNLVNEAKITVVSTKAGAELHYGGVVASTTQGPWGSGLVNKGDMNITLNASNGSPANIGGVFGCPAVLRSAMGACRNEGDITVTTTNSSIAVGGVVGRTSHKECNFTGYTNTGDITVTKSGGSSNTIVGGIIGYFSGSAAGAKLVNAENTGKVTLTYTNGAANAPWVGGLTGVQNCLTVSDSVNRGDVTVTGLGAGAQIGGLTGHIQSGADGSVSNSTNYGTVTVKSTDTAAGNCLVGGLVGKVEPKTTFTKVVNEGDIICEGAEATWLIAGIAATMAAGTINDATNNGMIKCKAQVTGVCSVTGIVGNVASAVINTAVNNGEIICEGNASPWRIAGIAGNLSAVQIDNVKNYGNITLSKASGGERRIGGINADVSSGTTWIRKAENHGDITAEAVNNAGTFWVGGISGHWIGNSTYNEVSNYGDIYASKGSTHYLGGIAGGVNVSADATTAAEMENLYNEGSVNGVGATSNQAYGGIIGRISNDNQRTNLPVHDIVNAFNIGAVKSGYLSGGIIGYAGSSRNGNPETARRYTVNLRECIALNTNGTYGLVGSARCAYMDIEDCFTDAEDFMTYCNQDTLYVGGTGITVNGVLYPEHYNLGDFKLNPEGVAYIDIETLDKAKVRLDSMATDESGIRFDSAISKKTYADLRAMDVDFEFGTLIAPTDNLNLAKVVASYDKMDALDALTGAGRTMYVLVPYEQEFLSEDVDNYYFAGALNKIKDANINLSFSAIAYLTVEYGNRSFTFYADYDDTNKDRARSVAQVAKSAFEDRATEETTIDGIDYKFPAMASNECYLGGWSLYSNTQLARLKAWSNYDNEGKVVPNGLTVNGVSISEYKIVYAQSPIYKTYGSNSGKTLFGDLSNVRMQIYTDATTPTGQYVEYGDTLLGARYDYDKQTAERLRDLIYAEYGVMLEVVPDYDIGADPAFTSDDVITPESDYEILVGFTNRAKSQSAALARMLDDDYTFKIDDTKIVVCGGAFGTTWHAVDALEELFATLENGVDYNLKMAGNLSGTYTMQKIATIGDSITRGSQALPDGNDYGGPGGASTLFGGNATETYYRYYLSYPANLQRLMWKEGVVYNFGRGASTAINLGNSNYYGGSAEWNKCKVTMETVAFDLVFLQHGTNDAGSVAANAQRETEYRNEIKAIADEFLANSNPNCKFVINSVPHAFDGVGFNRNEANDENMRRVQKETATALKAEGYDFYHFNMGEYTKDNLVNEGAEPCPGHTTAGDYAEQEKACHGDYYNIHTPYTKNEGTHPNFRGYNKMADGVYTVVQYILAGGAKPIYMIDIG